MEIKPGYVYHIKDEYFDKVEDKTLMRNHENGKARPTYFCVKEEKNEILWFIPMSSKVEKYKKIRDEKIKKYVDHSHMVNEMETRVIHKIEKEIKVKFDKLIRLTKQGKKVIFTDIEKDIKIMKEELRKE